MRLWFIFCKFETFENSNIFCKLVLKLLKYFKICQIPWNFINVLKYKFSKISLQENAQGFAFSSKSRAASLNSGGVLQVSRARDGPEQLSRYGTRQLFSAQLLTLITVLWLGAVRCVSSLTSAQLCSLSLSLSLSPGIYCFAEAHLCKELSRKAKSYALENFSSVAQYEVPNLIYSRSLLKLQFHIDNERSLLWKLQIIFVFCSTLLEGQRFECQK